MGGIVYVSTNLGATFVPTIGIGSVFAVSSNGSTILAYNGSDSNIFTSLDRGSTWITNDAPAAFSRFAASSDAQKIVASDGSVNVYTSTNFGTTWKGTTVPIGPSCLASSADGSHLYAGTYIASPDTYTGWVYGSSISANSWSTIGVFGDYIGLYSIACSADGSIVAVAGEGTVISTTAGGSWSDYIQPLFNNSVAVSADGNTMIADVSFDFIEVSPDTGTTWYMANAPYIDGKVLSSGDGNTLAAFDGTIYLSLPPPGQSSALSVATNGYNGLPVFQLTGQPGYSYAVEASTNLVDWTNIAVLVNTNGTVPFTDPASSNYNQRFYRAVISP